MLKQASRAAVDGYLKVLRKPVDAMINRTGGERSKALSMRLDRADAAARSVAGSALRDPALMQDAKLRREAADERERAQRLRGVASKHTEDAQEAVAEADAEAAERRRKAARTAERRKKQAGERKRREAEQAAEKSEEKERKSRKAAQATKANAEQRAKREKVAQLEKKERALAEEEASVNAAAESERLADAATKEKADRKKPS